MVKKHNITKIIIAALIILAATIGTLSASRTVSSKTIQIYAYIPSRTSVEVFDDGQINFTSNNRAATVDVIEQDYQTRLLSVVAR